MFFLLEVVLVFLSLLSVSLLACGWFSKQNGEATNCTSSTNEDSDDVKREIHCYRACLCCFKKSVTDTTCDEENHCESDSFDGFTVKVRALNFQIKEIDLDQEESDSVSSRSSESKDESDSVSSQAESIVREVLASACSFDLGEEVEYRSKTHWKRGIVTSLSPLKVKGEFNWVAKHYEQVRKLRVFSEESSDPDGKVFSLEEFKNIMQSARRHTSHGKSFLSHSMKSRSNLLKTLARD